MAVQETKYSSCLKLGVFTALLMSAVFLAGTFSTLQFRLHDPLHGGGQPLKNIIIIAIDDKSIQEFGRWPWDREIFAQLLSKLKYAKTIGIDVVFSETSNTASDEKLAEAIKKAGNVILAAEYTRFENEGGQVAGKNPLVPVPPLLNASKQLGIINLLTDDDGITRSANTNVKGEYLLFGQAIAESVANTKAPKQNRLLVNMMGARETFTTISFSDILKERIDLGLFKDAIILIGATAPDLHDDHLTPTSAGVPVPGVEIQANIVQMILTKKYLAAQPSWMILAALIAAAIIVSLLLARYNAYLVALFCILLLMSYFVAVILFFKKGILADMIFFPTTVILSYGLNLVHLYRVERRQKMQAVEAFTKYVAPEIVDELFKHPEKLKLGGERRTITIFFSDIRGFTTISEQLTPEQLVAVLNEYLTAMTDMIMASGGVVDKYMGDAIMAFWGAPLEQPDHAVRASECALQMLEKLKQLQQKWKKEGVPFLDIGMGLNTGDAAVGNMGSNQRFSYTCMGDNINLGSRLEGLNKEYGTHAIISEATFKKLPSDFIVRELDYVRVKGKKEPITIYELVGQGKIPEQTKQIIRHFTTGLKKYRKTEFKKALADFEKAAKLGDLPSKVYIERCEHFIKEHPGKAWDCVWVMKSK
ncbi:MAG: adenylate/guanylate cyclase domain-containing protein [Candidatus Aenigmarchaeota archaeon]|nr:adenylate/guanylate cyclase domain-containing protein [Candidatus Aenigmarchaeota archaeon]